jgi:hypothetical protein
MKYLLKRKTHTPKSKDELQINETVLIWFVNYPFRYCKILSKSKIDNTVLIKYKDKNGYYRMPWVEAKVLRKLNFL